MEINNLRSVSIIPTFWCNGRCPHCYLGDWVKDNTFMTPDVLRKVLDCLPESVENVDVYGGEVSAYGFERFNALVEPLRKFDHINITTNLALSVDFVRELLKDSFYSVGISLNKERITTLGRRMDEVVEKNLQSLSREERKKLTANVVVLPSVLRRKLKEILDDIERLGLGGLHLLEYSPSKQAKERYHYSVSRFEGYVIATMKEYERGNYSFTLELPKSEPFGNLATSHVFISPTGEFGHLAYDNDEEYFKFFSTIEEWYRSAERQDKDIMTRAGCDVCPFFGRCLGEHLRYNNQLKECGGYLHLTPYLLNQTV